jgi:DNA-binding transcriptional LysR family regulator
MRRHQVAVRCVSEYAMALRELALVGQGAAWLPASLIRDDLKRRNLLPLSHLGHSVRMDIVVFFAVLLGDRVDDLLRGFESLRGDQMPSPGTRVDRVVPRKGTLSSASAARPRAAA